MQIIIFLRNIYTFLYSTLLVTTEILKIVDYHDDWNFFLWFSIISSKCYPYYSARDQFLHGPSQWKTVLQCNILSHWLGAYTKWSLQCSPIYHNTAYSIAITTDEYRDQTQNTYLISWSSQAVVCCIGSHLIYLSKHDRKQEEIVVSLERYIANQTQTPIKPLLLHHDLLFWL